MPLSNARVRLAFNKRNGWVSRWHLTGKKSIGSVKSRTTNVKKRFSTVHRQNLALARLAKSQVQRDALLRLVAADEHGSDEFFGQRLGLKPRMVRKHLQTLREGGMIAVKIERHQGFKGWMNYRTIAITTKGYDAILKSEVRQQGNSQQGSGPPEADSGNDEDLF